MITIQKLTEGVYVVPPILSPVEINAIISPEEECALSMHHDDEGGHYVDTDHYEKYEERKQEEKRKEENKRNKKNTLPKVAQSLWSVIRSLDLGEFVPYGIDEQMKLYRLCENRGVVPAHRDEDFAGPNGSVARMSILVYLNNDFEGGETVFRQDVVAPHLSPGACLVFRHDVLHEGKVVTRGVKYVLKTDVFCKY